MLARVDRRTERMGYSVAGKHVLVTGASSGIGAALAEGFAAAGATVGICARREDRLAEVLARVQAHSPDSRSVDRRPRRPRRRRGVRRARSSDELGGIDVLVNNAGHPEAAASSPSSTRRRSRP